MKARVTLATIAMTFASEIADPERPKVVVDSLATLPLEPPLPLIGNRRARRAERARRRRLR